jgi:hypothetical protein
VGIQLVNVRADALSKYAAAAPAPVRLRSMPFGRHRGQSLMTVPSEYLLWLTRLPHLREPLRTAVHTELRQRHIAPLRSAEVSA